MMGKKEMKKTSTKMKKIGNKQSGRMERQPVTVTTKSGKKITV